MAIGRYIIARGLALFFTFLISIIIFFILMRVLPIILYGGNPFEPMQAVDPVIQAIKRTQEDPRFSGWIDYTLKLFGLEQPVLPNQLILFLKNVFIFDFGYSMYSLRKVSDEILIRLPYTLALYVYAIIVPIFLGYYTGILAVKHRGKFIDSLITMMGIFSFIMPSWIIILLIYYFLAYLPKAQFGITLLPLPVRTPSLSDFSLENIRYVLWYLSPLYIATLAAFFGSWTYFFRQTMIAEIENDYVTTAKAKGFSDSTVIKKEVVPNLKPPIITRLAYTLPGIFGGSLILEIISSWPGVAYYSFQAFVNFDYPVISAFFVISAMLLVISLFIADVLIAILDPRVRIGERR